MSKFLDFFVAEVAKTKWNMFSVAHMCGSEEPEVLHFQANNPCQDTYSVAKAFTVTAVGLLVDRGLLSVDETVTAILAEECPEDYHPYWDDTTVHMVLLHQLGLPGNCLDIDAQDAREFGSDYLRYMMTHPLSCPAGGELCYTDAAYYLLSRIVEKRSGMKLDDFLWRELFEPLGFREAAWSHCPLGHAMGATGLYIRVEDMAKLGWLYLNGGVWKDRRILSQAWVDTVIENGYELRPKGVGKAYSKGGMYGQMLLVIPEENRVVAWQAFGKDKDIDLAAIIAAYRDQEA